MTNKQPSREEATPSAHRFTVLNQLSRTIEDKKMFAQLRLKQLFPLKQETHREADGMKIAPEIQTNTDLELPASSGERDLQKTLEEVCRSSMFWAEILSEPSLLEDLKE